VPEVHILVGEFNADVRLAVAGVPNRHDFAFDFLAGALVFQPQHIPEHNFGCELDRGPMQADGVGTRFDAEGLAIDGLAVDREPRIVPAIVPKAALGAACGVQPKSAAPRKPGLDSVHFVDGVCMAQWQVRTTFAPPETVPGYSPLGNGTFGRGESGEPIGDTQEAAD
jgi:hypothetical protein